MSPGTDPSPKSPKGFFRLEPIQPHSSSGEARLGLNHVEDEEPFVTKSKRPWVSRRKARRPDPPWKKFVTVFRVAPIPVSFESASSIRSESPAPQYTSFGMDNLSMVSMDSTSSISSNLSRDYSLGPAPFVINEPNYLEPAYAGMAPLIQSVKHETSLQDMFGLADVFSPFHQDIHRSLPNHYEKHSS